jgi:multiple sugar transport system ATP-binding protein
VASLRLKNIHKRFGSVEVLHDINLEIKEGEFVVLVGPSGCGKSTTLRLIAGLEDITEGEVIINHNVVNLLEPQHRNIAMVFQNYALYPHKNVRENIIFGLKMAKVSRDIMDARLEKVAKMLELQDFLDRKPAQLSGGQRQRVAMGRAIVRDADVFLFDEPLSNLDAKLRHQMRSEIKRIHRAYQTTTLYVTHDQVEAMTMGDRIVVMKEGVIEQQGTPMEIYLKPSNTFVATFIGSPSMNLMDAKLFPEHVEIEGQRIHFKEKIQRPDFLLPKEGLPIKLGIRPDFFLDENFASRGGSLAKINNAKIDLIEPLGFDKELDVQVGTQSLKVRLDLRTAAKEGDTINLCFDMERAHFFDIKTDNNLFIQPPIRPQA